MIHKSGARVEAPALGSEEPFGLEKRIVSAGWQDAGELARAANAFGLHLDDFADRLCGVVVGYLRACGEHDRVPSLRDAVAMLVKFNVLNTADLDRILAGTAAWPDCTIVDLVQQIQRRADDRAVQDCRYVTAQATRLVLHAIGCPRCRRCADPGTSSRHQATARRGTQRRKAAVYV